MIIAIVCMRQTFDVLEIYSKVSRVLWGFDGLTVGFGRILVGGEPLRDTVGPVCRDDVFL